MLLVKENIRNYSGFCKDLSGYYIIFMNYIAALTLTKKILLLQFLSECSIEARPSKNKIFKWKSIPSTYPFIYHHQKAKTTFFATQKLLRFMRLLRVLRDRVPFKVFGEGFLFRVITKRGNFRVLSDSVLLRFLCDKVFFRFLSGRVLFRFLSGRVLFRVLNGRVLFDRFPSWVISYPFLMCHFFIKTCYYFALLKTDVLF